MKYLISGIAKISEKKIILDLAATKIGLKEFSNRTQLAISKVIG